MKFITELTFTGERAFFRPNGIVSTAELADIIARAMVQARFEQATNMLINITAMSGFSSPGRAYRRWVAGHWAKILGPDIKLAIVARAEHICPEKTGLLVAAEQGLHAHICESEEEAVTWLDTATIETDTSVG